MSTSGSGSPAPGDRAPEAESVVRSARSSGRFASLKGLRIVHTAILVRHEQAEDSRAPIPPGLLDEIEEFVALGAATGSVLDEEPERWEAQSLLDYWSTVLYRQRKPASALAVLPSKAVAGSRPRLAKPRLVAFDEQQLPTLRDKACPYRGLDAFLEEQSRYFFGRGRQRTFLIERIASVPLLAVVGMSGSGKSSLVRAGLIPDLAAGKALPGSDAWKLLTPMVPGSNPLDGLARLILESGGFDASRTAPPSTPSVTANPPEAQGSPDRPADPIQDLAERLRKDPGFLASCLDRPAGPPVVVVVDQFEEVFTLCTDVDAASAFIENLVGLVRSSDGGPPKNRVVLTMRTDFEVHVVRYPELRALFEAGRIAVAPMEKDELRQAIEEPAREVGLVFEKGVVEALVEDTYGEPAALPLLQFTLLQLWENRRRNKVTLESYRRLGGSRKALRTVADQLYEKMSYEEQLTARRIFLRMVRPGEGLEVTNRRIPLKDLFPAHDVHERIRAVLEKIHRARLVRITPGQKEDDTQVEVAHEALVRNWPTLVDWLSDERAAIVMRQRLETKAAEWVRRGRGSDALLDEAQLLEAERWLEGRDAKYLGVKPDLPALVEASRRSIEEADRQRRIEIWGWRKYTFGWIGACLLLVFAGLLWFAWAQHDQVKNLIPENLVLRAERIGAEDPDRADRQVLLAAEALRRLPPSKRDEARQVLLDGLALLPLSLAKLKHDSGVVALAFSSDGRTLAAATEGHRVRLYRIPSAGEKWGPVWEEPHGGPILKLAFSPDGRFLLATAPPPTTYPIAQSIGASGLTQSSPILVAMPKDAPAVEAVRPGESEIIRIYRVDRSRGDDEPFPDRVTASTPVSSAMISPAGTGLYAAGWDNTLWWAEKGAGGPRVRKVYDSETSASPGTLLFSPDGEYVLAPGSAYGVRSLLRLGTGAPAPTKMPNLPAIDAAFSSDGRMLALSTGQYVYVRDVTRGVQKWSIRLEDPDRLLAVSPDGRYGVFASRIALTPTANFAVADGFVTLQVAAPTGPMKSRSADPGASGERPSGSRALVIDLSTGQVVAHLMHDDQVVAADFRPDGTMLATAGRDGFVNLWSSNFGIGTSQAVSPDVLSVAAYSPDATLQAIATYKLAGLSEAPVVSSAQGANVRRSRNVVRASLASLAPLALLEPAEHRVHLFESRTGKLLQQWDAQGPIRSLDFSPDGRSFLAIAPAPSPNYAPPTVVFSRGVSGPVSVSPIIAGVPTRGREGQSGLLDALRLFPTAGNRMHEILSREGPIAAAASGPAIARLASSTWGARTILVDLETGERSEVSHRGPLEVAMSMDGSRLATIDWDNTVRVRARSASGLVPQATLESRDPVWSISFSPDGALVAVLSGGSDSAQGRGTSRPLASGEVRVATSAGGKVVSSMAIPSPVSRPTFSPDGTLLAAASQDGTVSIWAPHDGSPPIRRQLGSPGNMSLALGPGGRDLAAVNWNGGLTLCRVRGEEKPRVEKRSAFRGPPIFSPHGKYLAVPGWDSAVYVFGVPDLRQVARVVHKSSQVGTFAFGDGGDSLLTASVGEVLRTPLGGGPEVPLSLIGLDDGAIPVAFSPDGSRLTLSRPDGASIVHVVGDGKTTTQPLSHELSTRSFSGDGRVAALTTLISHTKITRVQDGSVLTTLPGEDPLRALAFHPFGHTLAAASLSGRALILEASTGQIQAVLPVDSPAVGVKFSLGGRLLAVTCSDGGVSVWDVENRKKLKDIPRKGRLVAPAFSQDERFLATTDEGQSILVWDLRGGATHDRPVIRVPQPGRVVAIAFSPDGQSLLTTSADNVRRTLPWSDAGILAEAETRVGRNFTAMEWQAIFHALPYERTFSGWPRGEGVTDEMESDPRKGIAELVGSALILVCLFLVVIPAGAVRATLREGAAIFVAVLVPLVASFWSLFVGPIVRLGAFALPSFVEKLLILTTLVGLALLSSRLQAVVVRAIAPAGSDDPVQALADWWRSRMGPGLTRLAHRPLARFTSTYGWPRIEIIATLGPPSPETRGDLGGS